MSVSGLEGGQVTGGDTVVSQVAVVRSPSVGAITPPPVKRLIGGVFGRISCGMKAI